MKARQALGLICHAPLTQRRARTLTEKTDGVQGSESPPILYFCTALSAVPLSDAVTHRSFSMQEVLHTLFFTKAGLMQTDWTIIDAFLFFSDFSHTIINSAALSVAFNNLLHTPTV